MRSIFIVSYSSLYCCRFSGIHLRVFPTCCSDVWKWFWSSIPVSCLFISHEQWNVFRICFPCQCCSAGEHQTQVWSTKLSGARFPNITIPGHARDCYSKFVQVHLHYHQSTLLSLHHSGISGCLSWHRTCLMSQLLPTQTNLPHELNFSRRTLDSGMLSGFHPRDLHPYSSDSMYSNLRSLSMVDLSISHPSIGQFWSGYTRIDARLHSFEDCMRPTLKALLQSLLVRHGAPDYIIPSHYSCWIAQQQRHCT